MNRRNPLEGDSTLYTDSLGAKNKIWDWHPREKISFKIYSIVKEKLLHKNVRKNRITAFNIYFLTIAFLKSMFLICTNNFHFNNTFSVKDSLKGSKLSCCCYQLCRFSKIVHIVHNP